MRRGMVALMLEEVCVAAVVLMDVPQVKVVAVTLTKTAGVILGLVVEAVTWFNEVVEPHKLFDVRLPWNHLDLYRKKQIFGYAAFLHTLLPYLAPFLEL